MLWGCRHGAPSWCHIFDFAVVLAAKIAESGTPLAPTLDLDISARWHMPYYMPFAPNSNQPPSRRVSLFRNGRNQAVRIPRDFEMPTKEAKLTKEGGRLILEPVLETSPLLDVLSKLPQLQEDFPDVDAGLPALDEVEL